MPDRNNLLKILKLYIATRINLKKEIPNNSLDPAIKLIVDNLVTDNPSVWMLPPLINRVHFGLNLSTGITAPDFCLASSINYFNQKVHEGSIKTDFCNPLSNLDILLEMFFIKGSLTKKQKAQKPIKGYNITLYDALKNIDYYLSIFYLSDKFRIHNGRLLPRSSYAGQSINHYLTMAWQEKESILKSISPEEFAIDSRKSPDHYLV